MLGLAGGDVETVGTRGVAVVWPRETAANPLLDGRDLSRRQFAPGRHLQVAVVADNVHKQALVGFARHRHALGREEVGPRVERQARLGIARLGRVALGAVSDQERPHLGLEELVVGRGVGSRLRRGRPGMNQGSHHRREVPGDGQNSAVRHRRHHAGPLDNRIQGETTDPQGGATTGRFNCSLATVPGQGPIVGA